MQMYAVGKIFIHISSTVTQMNHGGGRCNVISLSFDFSDFFAPGYRILLPQLTNRKFGTFNGFIILINV